MPPAVFFTIKLIILSRFISVGGNNRKERLFGIFVALLSIKVSVLLPTYIFNTVFLIIQYSFLKIEPKLFIKSILLPMLMT